MFNNIPMDIYVAYLSSRHNWYPGAFYANLTSLVNKHRYHSGYIPHDWHQTIIYMTNVV